jgi:hypothetical protein
MDIRERPLDCLQLIGVVFQQPTLDLDLSVEQNLLYHRALHGISHRDAARRIATEIERKYCRESFWPGKLSALALGLQGEPKWPRAYSCLTINFDDIRRILDIFSTKVDVVEQHR